MKIRRLGDREKIRETKHFLCRNCGCIWDADKWEYKVSSQYNDDYYYCKCPFEGCDKNGYEISEDELRKELSFTPDEKWGGLYKFPVIPTPIPEPREVMITYDSEE